AGVVGAARERVRILAHRREGIRRALLPGISVVLERAGVLLRRARHASVGQPVLPRLLRDDGLRADALALSEPHGRRPLGNDLARRAVGIDVGGADRADAAPVTMAGVVVAVLSDLLFGRIADVSPAQPVILRLFR